VDTTAIETIITDQCSEHHAETDIHDLLAAVAGHQGIDASEADLQRGTEFVYAYIRQVPYMIKVALTAAEMVGLREEMKQVVAMVTRYWEQDDDIIPDHLGVIGLLDDAYCSLTSMQAVSDHFQLQTGKFLFPDDLTSANKAMRKIIGEPYASDLDRIVIRTMQETHLVQAVKKLASEEKQILFARQSTIWNHNPAGDMSIDDLAGLGLVEN